MHIIFYEQMYIGRGHFRILEIAYIVTEYWFVDAIKCSLNFPPNILIKVEEKVGMQSVYYELLSINLILIA